MSPQPKLRLLMLRDAMYFVVLLSWFFLPEPYGMLLFIAVAFTVGKRIEKAIKANPARLESAEKRTYFLFTLLYFLVLLGLLLSWIIRHSSPPAWAMGSLGIVVLLTLLYASYDSIYGHNAKV